MLLACVITSYLFFQAYTVKKGNPAEITLRGFSVCQLGKQVTEDDIYYMKNYAFCQKLRKNYT